MIEQKEKDIFLDKFDDSAKHYQWMSLGTEAGSSLGTEQWYSPLDVVKKHHPDYHDNMSEDLRELVKVSSLFSTGFVGKKISDWLNKFDDPKFKESLINIAIKYRKPLT